MVIPYSIFIRILRSTLDWLTYSYFERKYEGRYEGEILDRKVRKCSRGLFKVIHFGYLFLLGWLKVLGETNFHSPLMFGEGNTFYVFSDWPYTPMPSCLKFYYMMSMSYYVEDLIMHVISPPNSDYWEMILHHLIAAMLIFASYMNGIWVLGIFVLMQMDCADIFVGMIRVIMDFSSVFTNFIVYSGIMISWFYFRFVAYTYIVVYVWGFAGRISVDGYTRISSVLVILLFSLLGLNIYWFILLGRMGYRMVFKGKTVDLQNIVTKKDVQMD